ncbi:MAG: TetR/AcrR family transcriptional regulator [Spirochaetota bacterium]
MTKRKQQQILNTAETMFNRFGIKKTAVDDIARDAKVAKATIYNYFGNKEGLLKALIAQKIQQFEARLLKSTESTINPVEAIRSLIQEHISLFTTNPFINDPALQDNELKEELGRKEEHVLQKVVQLASSRGLLQSGDSNQIIHILLLLLKGMESSINKSISFSMDSLNDSINFISKTFFKNTVKEGYNGTA